MKWFGASWGAPVNEDTEWAPTPIGEPCMNCDEPIDAEDQGVLIPTWRAENIVTEDPWHLACHVRGIVGSVGHQLGTCSCRRPLEESEEDPPGMTKREAAEAAFALWGRRPWPFAS